MCHSVIIQVVHLVTCSCGSLVQLAHWFRPSIDEVVDISDYLVNQRKYQIFSLGLAVRLRNVPTLDKIRDSPKHSSMTC